VGGQDDSFQGIDTGKTSKPASVAIGTGIYDAANRRFESGNKAFCNCNLRIDLFVLDTGREKL
jgi:hypothetical protein